MEEDSVIGWDKDRVEIFVRWFEGRFDKYCDDKEEELRRAVEIFSN